MPNSYQPNDKFPASVQPVYVAKCITHGFFQNLWRTIGDDIFVHIVTSSVYITSMATLHIKLLCCASRFRDHSPDLYKFEWNVCVADICDGYFLGFYGFLIIIQATSGLITIRIHFRQLKKLLGSRHCPYDLSVILPLQKSFTIS